MNPKMWVRWGYSFIYLSPFKRWVPFLFRITVVRPWAEMKETRNLLEWVRKNRPKDLRINKARAHERGSMRIARN